MLCVFFHSSLASIRSRELARYLTSEEWELDTQRVVCFLSIVLVCDNDCFFRKEAPAAERSKLATDDGADGWTDARTSRIGALKGV